MCVDAQCCGHASGNSGGGGEHVGGELPAVGVAQHEGVCTSSFCRQERFHCVVGVVGVSVEEVFCVQNDAPAFGYEESDRFFDHGEVLVRRYLEGAFCVTDVRFGDQGDDGCFGVK